MTPAAAACRVCGAALGTLVVDLGLSPLANSYVAADALGRPETFYPLRAWLCEGCWLVQLEAVASPAAIFGDYPYFSSYSDGWLRHARAYADMAVDRFGLGPASRVVEIASNDGYLLQYFVARGIPVLGIEPAVNVARAATARGVPTRVELFGAEAAARLAAEGWRADLVVGNNVLAHVPDLDDFLRGMTAILVGDGVVTLEFPHLLRLLAETQFDTIYHEHVSYFSLLSAEAAFRRHGLVLFDVDELPTHGGSLRVYLRHADDAARPVTDRVGELRRREVAGGLTRVETYREFAERVKETKRRLLEFLIDARRRGRTIAGYGAAAKAATLLNYCGVRTDFIDYTVDRSPHKQGRYLPGTRIPIHHPDRIRATRPDYVLILPWNLQDEIVEAMAHVRDWGGAFVVPIPEVKVLP